MVTQRDALSVQFQDGTFQPEKPGNLAFAEAFSEQEANTAARLDGADVGTKGLNAAAMLTPQPGAIRGFSGTTGRAMTTRLVGLPCPVRRHEGSILRAGAIAFLLRFPRIR